MSVSDERVAILEAGGASWRRSLRTPHRWVFGITVYAMIAGGSVYLVGDLVDSWQPTLRCFVEMSLFVLAILAVNAAYLVLSLRMGSTTTSLSRLLRHARALESAAAGGGEDGPVVRGAIATTPDGKASALFREASTLDVRGQPAPHVRVTAQPFVVEGPGGPWLIETAFIEAFDKTPSRAGRAAVDGELSIGVDDEVVIRAPAQEQVQAPPWVANAVGLPGYRDRRIRRLIGTEKDPIRIWRVPSSG